MNRTSYYGSRPYRWLIGVLFIIFFGVLVWAFYSALFDATAHPSDRQAGAWMCLLVPAILYFLAWAFREVSAVYTVDADGIEKRIWGRSHGVDWDDIIDFHVAQDRANDYKLVGRNGERLAVWCSRVGRGRDELARVLD